MKVPKCGLGPLLATLLCSTVLAGAQDVLSSGAGDGAVDPQHIVKLPTKDAAQKCKCISPRRDKCFVHKNSAFGLESTTIPYNGGSSNSNCRCSRCGTAPANADSVCQAGTCTFACKAGFSKCGSSCINCPSKAGSMASCNATTGTCEYRSVDGCQNGTISCGGKCLTCPQPPAGRAFCNDNGQCDLACTAGWTRKKDANGVYSICEKDPVSAAVAMPAGNYTAWVGGLNTIAGFNGKGWEIRFPNSYITAIAIVNETWAAAVGGNDYYMFNGTTWLKFEDENGLWGIATGEENLWLVGEEGYVWLIYADATLYWGQVPGTRATLLNVAALADKAAIAVGTQGTIVRVKGTAQSNWKVEPSGVNATLNSVAAVMGQPAWIVGNQGTILRYTNNKWVKVASGTKAHLYGVAGVSDNLAVAVGARGTILQWDGSKWIQSAQSGKWQVTFNDVTILAGNRAYIVGDNSIMLGWSDGEWTVITNEGIGRYLAITTMPASTSSGRKLLQTSMLPPLTSMYTPPNSECYRSTRTVAMTSTGAALSGTSLVTLPVCPNPTALGGFFTNRCNRSATLTTSSGAPAVTCSTRWDGTDCPQRNFALCVDSSCGLLTDQPPPPLTTPINRFLKYAQNTASGAVKLSGGVATVVDESWFFPCVTATQTGWPWDVAAGQIVTGGKARVCDSAAAVTMQCSTGVIAVADAVYTRPADSKCPGPVGSCGTSNVASAIRGRCEGQRNCILTGDTWRTVDPCPGVLKELVVDFKCRVFDGSTARVCDSAAPVTMQCSTGVIVVTNAVYTRPPDTRCPGPAGECRVSDLTSAVKTRCDGQTACTLTGDTYKTSDPCPNILKELRVDYKCQAPPNVTSGLAGVCDSAAPVTMECLGGSIAVTNAVYTRPSDTKCPGPAGSCNIGNVTSTIKSRCDGRATCALTGDTFKTVDPCSGVLKELRVDYRCQVNGTAAKVCDNTAAVAVQCTNGAISVGNAVYTRPSDTKCPGPVGNCPIANVTSTIKAMCDGKETCILTGDTYRTNNPCDGVTKELRVDYSCQAIVYPDNLKGKVCDSATPVYMGCPTGVISVTNAVYTRPADTKCPGPAGSCGTSNVFEMIKAKCNGFAQCLLTGDTYKTEDPCPNVLKELVVDYKCQAPCTPTTCCDRSPTTAFDNGAWNACVSTATGQTCGGECFDGFVRNGTPSIKCVGGNWDSASVTGACEQPASARSCEISKDTCLTGACGVRCGVDPAELLEKVVGMQQSQQNAALSFMEALRVITLGTVNLRNMYNPPEKLPGPVQGGVVFNDGILGLCPMWPKTALYAEEEQDREALALKMAYKIEAKTAASLAHTWVRTASTAKAIINIPFSECDEPECVLESYMLATVSIMPHPITKEEFEALTFAAAARPCGDNRMVALGIDGLSMSVPLYPGPPSFELGLELTGVGIFFDGTGELGSLIQMLDPFTPGFEEFKLPSYLIVAGTLTVSAGLLYVPEGGKQPIQVTANGDMTLGVTWNYTHTPFRLRDSKTPTQVQLGGAMYNLEVYPVVTFFEVLEINFKTLAAFKASVFIALGKNTDPALCPVGEYEVVRLASAFAMDLNQIVGGITLLNAPIPIAKIINEFAGIFFPVTYKFQLELHAYLSAEPTSYQVGAIAPYDRTWGIGAYGKLEIQLKLPWQIKPAMKAADLLMRALANKRAGDLVPYFEGLNLGQTLNQLIDGDPVTALSFEGGIVIRQLPNEDFWNLYLARKDEDDELVLSQVPTCGGPNQNIANKVCGPDQFCLTGDSISTLAAVAATVTFLLPLPGNVVLGPALAALAKELSNSFTGVCANLGSRDAPCLSDFMCSTGNCISGTCSPGWPGAPCQQKSDCYGGGQCNQCIGTGRCPECDGECINTYTTDPAASVNQCRLAYRDEPCRFDSDCLSQRCNDGTYRNAARKTCGIALAGKPCVNDGDCVSNRCVNKKPGYNGLVVGVCDRGYRDEGCAGDGDCNTGRCTPTGVGKGYNDKGVWKSCGQGFAGAKCKRDFDCVTLNCINYAPDENGVLAGTCGKAPRNYGCNSDADCLSGRCTVDGATTDKNFYNPSKGYQSCGPANEQCSGNYDCISDNCRGGKWSDTDGPNNGRTVGLCSKGSKDGRCASDKDCLSGRCTGSPGSCAPGWPNAKCRRDSDCVTFACMDYAPEASGEKLGTCRKGPRNTGCGSNADCITDDCTVDGASTAFNYYYNGAFRSCAPRNMGCYTNDDCLTTWCQGGSWAADSPDAVRTPGQCVKGNRDDRCTQDSDCKSNRCTCNFLCTSKTCAG